MADGHDASSSVALSTSAGQTTEGINHSAGAPAMLGRDRDMNDLGQPATKSRNSRRSLHDRARLQGSSLQALSSTATSPTSQDSGLKTEVTPLSGSSRILPRVVKGSDDPLTSPSHIRVPSNRQSNLSHLFAVYTSPESSRNSSYVDSSKPTTSYGPQGKNLTTAPLPDHLYRKGLLEGKHSDITVRAFGQSYKLHRLILDRAPFFATALSEPWLEAQASEIAVHPEEIDLAITQTAFELALQRLYGQVDHARENEHAIGLFATGCWLEMQDLKDSAISRVLHQMTPQTLGQTITLVTNNYYGQAGDKILASAKAMLCRHGWKMPLRDWDDIPAEVVREVVGGDGFYVGDDWERWFFAKRLLDWRLRKQAKSSGLTSSDGCLVSSLLPYSTFFETVRSGCSQFQIEFADTHGLPDVLQPLIDVYAHHEVSPLLELLDRGIHYMHLQFEQLQYIRSTCDALGLPSVPEKIISDALWQQIELRQQVINAREQDHVLGLSYNSETSTKLGANDDMRLKSLVDNGLNAAHDVSGGNMARKYWIPTADCNIVMGGNAEPIVVAARSGHDRRTSTHLMSSDSPTETPPTIESSQREPRTSTTYPPSSSSYTCSPPFRFAVEFPNPKQLKDRKRIYSRSVFYAGSLWNVYIQKVASTRSKQLGVYLHRAKESHSGSSPSSVRVIPSASVDQRIGRLEQGFASRHLGHFAGGPEHTAVGADVYGDDSGDSSENAEGLLHLRASDSYETAHNEEHSARSDVMRNLMTRSNRRGQKSNISGTLLGTSFDPQRANVSQDRDDVLGADEISERDADEAADLAEQERLLLAARRFPVATLPPYTDARASIQTYFKIYSPSRGGRMLSVYESAPDKFDFAQSWGWRSSSLMLDEDLLDDGNEVLSAGMMNGAGEDGSTGEHRGNGGSIQSRDDGKLRFMVVIGNI